jgi:hypothetical protein
MKHAKNYRNKIFDYEDSWHTRFDVKIQHIKFFFFGVPHLAFFSIIEWTRIGCKNQSWHGFDTISI